MEGELFVTPSVNKLFAEERPRAYVVQADMQIDYNVGDNDEQDRERDVSEGPRAASAMQKDKMNTKLQCER